MVKKLILFSLLFKHFYLNQSSEEWIKPCKCKYKAFTCTAWVRVECAGK